MELNTKKFLETDLICVNGIYNSMVDRKSTKLPITWSSKVPKRYGHSAIIGDLHRSKRISMKFTHEVKHIKTKLLQADDPLRLEDSISK